MCCHVDLAEDTGKNDQYCKVDPSYNSAEEVHKRLFAHTKHEGKLFYILVCRVSLGHHVRSDCGKNVFPITNRELAFVPTTMPPVHYHSLLGVDFPRYREFIVFHTEYIYPEVSRHLPVSLLGSSALLRMLTPYPLHSI